MKKRLKKIACTLIICIVSFLACVKYWAGPNIARQKFLTYLSRLWAGHVQVEKVKFNLFGSLHFNRVSFLGPEGRQWAYGESFKVTLENWPRLKIKLENIKIDSLKLQLHIDDREWASLFSIFSKETKQVKKKYLPSISIKHISAYLVDGEQTELIPGGFSFLSQQKEDLYEFSLITKHPDEVEKLEASGTINLENMQTDVSVEINHQVTMEEATTLVRLFSGLEDYRCEGHITSNVKVSGFLKDLNSIQPEGTVKLTNVSLSYKEFQSVAKSINSNILLSKNNISSKNLSAVFYEGSVDGSFNIDYSPSGPSEIDGEFKVKELQLTELAKDFESLGTTGKGTADVKFVFSATGKKPNSLNGHGYIQLYDSDLFDKPITSDIFQLIGLEDQHRTRNTDAVCVFTKKGPLLTIEKAEATSTYCAIVVEPEGTVDLKKNWIDLYIIAVPVKAFRGLLEQIPLISIIAKPKDKLMRFHVEGNLSDPPRKLIKKQPFRDVAASAFSFFEEVANTGGELTNTTVNSAQGLFETLAGRNDKK